MTYQTKKAHLIGESVILKEAVQGAVLNGVARISDYAHLIPAISTAIGSLTKDELRDAIGDYLSAIVYAKSVEEQVLYVCLAIVARAIWMRGIHTEWRLSLPATIKQHARYARLGFKYYVKDIRAFSEAALAHTWPEILA